MNEEDIQYLDDELDSEDLTEEEEEEPTPKKARVKKKVVKKRKPVEEQKQPQRYTAFSQPARIGIADAETNEVIAEGEFAPLQMLADIKAQLDRIENSVGGILDN